VWRISAIFVSGVPIYFIASKFLLKRFCYKYNKPTWMDVCEMFIVLITIIMAFLYIFARIVLLVLPFAALRALPPDAYVQLNWVSFLPHI
jgi:hypothetical protein